MLRPNHARARRIVNLLIRPLLLLLWFGAFGIVDSSKAAGGVPEVLKLLDKQVVLPKDRQGIVTVSDVLRAVNTQFGVNVVTRAGQTLLGQKLTMQGNRFRQVLDEVAKVTDSTWRAEEDTIIFSPVEKPIGPTFRRLRLMGRLGVLDEARAALRLLDTIDKTQRASLVADGFVPWTSVREDQRALLRAFPTGRVMPVVENQPLLNLPEQDLYFIGGFYLSIQVKLNAARTEQLFIFRGSVGDWRDSIILLPLRSLHP